MKRAHDDNQNQNSAAIIYGMYMINGVYDQKQRRFLGYFPLCQISLNPRLWLMR